MFNKEDRDLLEIMLTEKLIEPEIYRHSIRTYYYASQLSKLLKVNPYGCNIVNIGALVHEIGKIGIPKRTETEDEKSRKEISEYYKHAETGYKYISKKYPKMLQMWYSCITKK